MPSAKQLTPEYRAAQSLRMEVIWAKRRAGALPTPKGRGPNKPKPAGTPTPASTVSRLESDPPLALNPDTISPTELRGLVRRRITEALIRGVDVREILAASKSWELLFGESDFRVTDEERELILKWRAYRQASPAAQAAVSGAV